MHEPERAPGRIREAAIAAPAAKVLVLTGDMSPRLAAGRSPPAPTPLVSKDCHPVALGTLVRELADGHVAQRGGVDAAVADGRRRLPADARELEILRLAAEG